MPYTQHDLFTDPEGEDLKLWRYMDYTKFVSILQTKSLFFPSARILKKIDPWEGTWPKKELSHILKNIFNLSFPKSEDRTYENHVNFAKVWEREFDDQLDTHFISCWHYNSTESAAMWGLYLKSNEGIAIQTQFKGFRKSFDSFEGAVFIGEVRYMNYENDVFFSGYDLNKVRPTFNLLLPVIHKRKNYEYENEYRAISPFESNKMSSNDIILGGKFVPVNLENLIEKVVLAPGCPKWFEDLVNKTLSKYEVKTEVVRSVVDAPPFQFDLEPHKTEATEDSESLAEGTLRPDE